MLEALCRTLVRRPINLLAAILERGLLHDVPFADVEGLRVGVHRGISDRSLHGRVIAALELIKSVEPRRYRRLLRNITRIAVVQGKLQGYSEPLGVCWLSDKIMRRWSDAITAAIIVHAATQARFASAGISAWGQAEARVRAQGIRDQVAFLKRLPEGWYPDRWAYIHWLEAVATAADLSAA